MVMEEKKDIIFCDGLVKIYKTKEIAARKAIDDYNAGVSNYYYTNLNWIGQKLMEQPKYVMASYKNFVEKLKKI